MKTSIAPVIVWFRQDLRIHDNPALYYAVKQNLPIIFLYIYDDTVHPWEMGAASKWWLHQSLHEFNQAIQQKYGANYILRKGEPLRILKKLHQEVGFSQIYWNFSYEPYLLNKDLEIVTALKALSIETHTYNGALLQSPSKFLNQSKQCYKIFTPFWRALLKQPVRKIFPAPKNIKVFSNLKSLSLDQFKLLPEIRWDKKLTRYWQPGEKYAQAQLRKFIKNSLEFYNENRDKPGIVGTSLLSPYLHWGEVSPCQVWHAIHNNNQSAYTFLSELAWREFSYHLLYHFPSLPDFPLKPHFKHFSWENSKSNLEKWQKGETGYPIVDAGMKQLYATGWMHNRVRMIVASFLIKDLLIDWRAGAAWFWDTLIDADLANNSASWQWVAGSGADSAPFFRIFNPIVQGEKFDPDGKYVAKWLPQLKKLPSQFIHKPWLASDAILVKSKVILGKTYPFPIVEHAKAREKALDAFKKLKDV